jgi:hypothetical protein
MGGALMLWQSRGLVQTGKHWRRGRGVAVVESPDTIFGADLLAWYKADTGVYTDAGVTLATDGQTVQQWNDQSGNGDHLLQATSSNRPTFDTTGFNSRQGLVFDGTNDWMATTTDTMVMGTGTQSACFVVCRVHTGSPAFGRIAGYVPTGQTNDTPGTGAVYFYREFATDWRNYRAGNKAVATISFDANHRIGSVFDGTNAQIYVDGIAGTSGNSTEAFGSPGTFVLSNQDLVTPSNFSNVTIAEALVVKRAPTAGERDSLDAYFTDKWGL